ncbi:zinc finger, CCHC-type containing protein [Tanacetum coccineum]
MKSNLQDQDNDPTLWDVLKSKFERSSTTNTYFREDGFHSQRHDDHQEDDAPPEGDKRVKIHKQQQEWDAWEGETRVDEDEVILERSSTTTRATTRMGCMGRGKCVDEDENKGYTNDMLTNQFQNAEECAYHSEQATNFIENQIVWESRQEDIRRSIPKDLVLYGPQRNLNEPSRYLYNKDLFFLKNGNTEEKKIIEVVRITIDQQYGLDFMEQILVMRENDKPVSFSEADFKYLNKNDIKDLYYLCRNNANLTYNMGHIDFKRMQDMLKDGLIPAFDMDIEKWNKKYFMTFIDDASRFYYVYLLHSKDEALDKFKGCREVVRLLDLKLKNLGERGIECIFVGYAEHSKAFRFFVIEHNESFLINSIIESMDAILDENRFFYVPRSNLRISNRTGDIGGSVVLEEVVQQPEPELRKSKRNRTPKTFGHKFQLYLFEEKMDDISNQNSCYFNVEDDPKTFDEAIKSHDVAFWKKAINDEMDSIMGNNTWVLANLPPGCKPLGCKWIFKRKLKIDGTIEKFKARLIIRCFRQKSGIGYFDTYASVAHISTIRLLIVKASIYNLIIHQMDVKTAFLNGELDEKVYMNQPQGFIMPVNEKKVDLTKEFLSSRFSIKDMGEADVILGILVILCWKVTLMQAGSATLKTISLQVAGYSYLVVVQFLGLPRSKLALMVKCRYKRKQLGMMLVLKKMSTNNDEAYVDFSSENKNIENMTVVEYNLYVAKQSLGMNPLRIGAENMKQMGQDIVQDNIWEQDDDLEEDQEDDGNDRDTFDIWDITVEDVERIRQFFTPNVPDVIENVIQPLIPKTLHTTPPNEDYVAPTTKSILDDLLEEFGDEILNVTMVDEGAKCNPAKDLEELERLLAKEPQSNFTEIQVLLEGKQKLRRNTIAGCAITSMLNNGMPNMEMEPDIENMTMSEYLEYEADDDLEDDQEEDEDVIQPLIPKNLHTTPPNEGYVAPVTKPILDDLLEEFGNEILNVTIVDEEADFNPTKDIEELEKLLDKDPLSHYT